MNSDNLNDGIVFVAFINISSINETTSPKEMPWNFLYLSIKCPSRCKLDAVLYNLFKQTRCTWHLALLSLRSVDLHNGSYLSIYLHIFWHVDLEGRIGRDAEGCHFFLVNHTKNISIHVLAQMKRECVTLKIKSFCWVNWSSFGASLDFPRIAQEVIDHSACTFLCHRMKA